MIMMRIIKFVPFLRKNGKFILILAILVMLLITCVLAGITAKFGNTNNLNVNFTVKSMKNSSVNCDLSLPGDPVSKRVVISSISAEKEVGG